MAAFRIGLGIVLIWDLSISLSNVSAFYSNEGFLPLGTLDTFNNSPWQWSIHTWSASANWQVVLLTLHLVCAICVLIGYRTQLATLVCWILICSLHTRNPILLHSGDMAIRLLFFWSIFLPLGARWSVDEIRGRISTFRSSGEVATISSLSILIQVCMIYWMSALLKDGVEWRHDGTAVYYALSLDQFVTRAGRYLLNFPNFCRIATFGTWWLEVIGPTLALLTFRHPLCRVLVVVAFFTLHIALWILFRLGPFSATMLSAWLLFLPTRFWDSIEIGFRHTKNAHTVEHSLQSWMRHPFAQSFTSVCLVYMILWNLRGAGLDNSTKWFPHTLDRFGYALNIDQHWAMFAPRPSTDDGWVVMEAILANGLRVDILRDGRPISFEKPNVISSEFRDSKWHKVILSVWHPPYQEITPHLGNYFAFQWNAKHQASEQIRGWTLWYMREDTLERGQCSIPVKIELIKVGQF
jgi:hypothetical protein